MIICSLWRSHLGGLSCQYTHSPVGPAAISGNLLHLWVGGKPVENVDVMAVYVITAVFLMKDPIGPVRSRSQTGSRTRNAAIFAHGLKVAVRLS